MIIYRQRKSKYKFKVRRSSAGLGLYTVTPIKKDDFIIEYFGPLLTDDEADKKGGKYLFQISKKWTRDGVGRGNIARYINHSCKPNSEAEISGKCVYIYAIKNIKPGEELSYHYGKEYFNDYILPEGCMCKHCLK